MDAIAVSVVIPVYNRPRLIGEAIACAIDAASSVTFEIIAVDDASTDETWDVLQRLGEGDARVRVARMARNGGQSAARNHALTLARGRYVKFLDSDDLLLPDHLPREVRALDDGADIAVSGWQEELPSGGIATYDAPQFVSIVDDVLAGRAVPTSSALYRRDRGWQWDPSLRKLDDWDFFCQAALGASRIDSVPGAAYVLRGHSGARASDVSLLANAREHHAILGKIERRLAGEGRLTDARRRRLAQYFYRELRVLSLHDQPAFRAAMAHILELDPRFRPTDEEPQRLMRLLAAALGTERAVRLHTAIKRAVMPLRRRRTA